MNIWVLQYRESGEEDQISLFSNEQSAKQRAYDIFYDMAKWNGTDENEIPNNLDDLEELCSDYDYGYFQIYEQRVEQ